MIRSRLKPMKIDLDVLVVGGGPAGSSCAAILASSGIRTAIVESGDFSRFRIGETVRAEVFPLLRQIGISSTEFSKVSRRCPGIVSVWGNDRRPASQPGILNPYGEALRIERAKFDKLLFEFALSAGAIGFTNARLDAAKREN